MNAESKATLGRTANGERTHKDVILGMKNKRPLTTGEAAKYCHVSRVAVLDWIKAGKIDAYCLPGGQHRIPREAFRAFLEKYKMPIYEEFFSEK